MNNFGLLMLLLNITTTASADGYILLLLFFKQIHPQARNKREMKSYVKEKKPTI